MPAVVGGHRKPVAIPASGMDEEHPRHQALRPGVLHGHRVRALTSRAAFPLAGVAFAIASHAAAGRGFRS